MVRDTKSLIITLKIDLSVTALYRKTERGASQFEKKPTGLQIGQMAGQNICFKLGCSQLDWTIAQSKNH